MLLDNNVCVIIITIDRPLITSIEIIKWTREEKKMVGLYKRNGRSSINYNTTLMESEAPLGAPLYLEYYQILQVISEIGN